MDLKASVLTTTPQRLSIQSTLIEYCYCKLVATVAYTMFVYLVLNVMSTQVDNFCLRRVPVHRKLRIPVLNGLPYVAPSKITKRDSSE